MSPWWAMPAVPWKTWPQRWKVAWAGEDRWDDWHAELAREKQTWANDLHDVRTTPSFPYEPAYLGTLLRGLLPPETILVTGVGIRHAIGQHYPFSKKEPRSSPAVSGRWARK